MSDLQSDIADVDNVFDNISVRYGWPAALEAWQRLKPRLTPDRDMLIEVMRDSGYVTHRQAIELADAAIAAMGEGK